MSREGATRTARVGFAVSLVAAALLPLTGAAQPLDAGTPGAVDGGSTSAPAVSPAELYAQLGCRICHGWSAPFDQRIRLSSTKSPETVARWIRDAQSLRPGSQMPSYAEVIDDAQALALAEWLRQQFSPPGRN